MEKIPPPLRAPPTARLHLGYLALLASVLLAGLLASAWYVRSQPMSFLESGYASRRAQQMLIQACDFGELAVFGDSMAEAAIVPAELGGHAVNLAFGAASPIELSYWVESALQCPQLPRTVLLSLEPYQFEHISPFLWANQARQGFLDFSQLQAIQRDADRLRDSSFDHFRSPDGLSGTARNLLYGMRFPALYFDSLVAARFNGRLQANLQKFAVTLKNRGHSGYTGDGRLLPGAEVPVPAGGQFHPLPLQDMHFRRLVDALAARGVQLIFLPMPLSPAGDTPLARAHRAAFLRYLQGVAGQQPALRIGVPAPVIWAAADFADGLHLAAAAAPAYSRKLKACLDQVALAPAGPAMVACH